MKTTNKILCIIIAVLLLSNIISLSILIVNKDKKPEVSREEFINEIKVGLSEAYINEKLGLPEATESFETRDEVPQKYQKAGYKLENASLFCIYDEGSLIGFCIIINENGAYSVIRASTDENENILGAFAYNDFSEFYSKYSANVAASSLTASYYCEIYEGNSRTDYVYCLLGSYISFKEYENLILHTGQDSLIETQNENKMTEELEDARKNSHPNVYAEFSRELKDTIDSPADFITRNAQQVFFEKW